MKYAKIINVSKSTSYLRGQDNIKVHKIKQYKHAVAVNKFLLDSNKQPESFPLKAPRNKLLSGFFTSFHSNRPCFLHRLPVGLLLWNLKAPCSFAVNRDLTSNTEEGESATVQV